MRIRKTKILPQSRWWNKSQLASHFSCSIEWLNKNYKMLLLEGMPDMDRLFKAWDSAAIEAWEDNRSQIFCDPVSRDARQFEQELANGEI